MVVSQDLLDLLVERVGPVAEERSKLVGGEETLAQLLVGGSLLEGLSILQHVDLHLPRPRVVDEAESSRVSGRRRRAGPLVGEEDVLRRIEVVVLVLVLVVVVIRGGGGIFPVLLLADDWPRVDCASECHLWW